MKKEFMTIGVERKLKQKTFKDNVKLWFEQKKYLSQSFANGVTKARKTAGVILVAALLFQTSMGVFGTNATATQSGSPNLIGSLAVGNVNTGTEYKEDYVDAKVDHVVKFQMIYHNLRPPSSGIVAHNVNVKIALPTEQGTNLVATGSAKGSDTNTLTDTAAVHTEVPTNLEYVSGSAKWRHNVGTNEAPNWITESIPDSVVTTGYNVGDVKPCENFQGGITILARLKASSLKVVKKVAISGESWSKENTAKVSDTLSYLITFENMGNTTLTNMVVADNLPPHMVYIPGSTTLTNTAYPSGFALPDGVTTGGVTVGNYNPGSNGHVKFKVNVNNDVPNGCNRLKNVGIAKADQTLNVWDTAYTKVCVTVPEEPEFIISKSAYNETQNVDATTTYAHDGDVIRYNLTTKNIGLGVGDYTITDDISNILVQADITDTGGGTVTSGVISYGTVTINPGQTVTKNFWAEVKPFEEWPNGCITNLKMVNVYGNEVIVKLGCYWLNRTKSAYNSTKGVDATSTKAHPGDSITYTLITSNSGNDTVKGHIVSDDISDILENAEVTDTGGGTITNGVISWPALDITAGSSVKNIFTVKINEELAKACMDFDLVNTYGNTVVVYGEEVCPPPFVPKVLGEKISRLAAAGGNSFILFGLMFFMFVSSLYLYMRERILLVNTLRGV